MKVEIAQAFEDAIGLLWDGEGISKPFDIGKEEFSCNAIRYNIDNEEAYWGARSMLTDYERFGWGFFPIDVQDTVSEVIKKSRMLKEEFDAPKRQLCRALWLTLLAEMAEQGDLDVEEN